MSVDWIDHIVVPVSSLEDAVGPYERLGLHLTARVRHEELGTENRALFGGDGYNDFYIEFLAIHDRQAALANSPARTDLYLSALDAGGGAARLMLGTEHLAGFASQLATKDIRTTIESVSREGGGKIGDVAALDELLDLGARVGVIQYAEQRQSQHIRRQEQGYFAHSFPLKRLDHLAVMAPQLEATTDAWRAVLGVPVYGEVEGRGLLIRQMKIGNAIVELLGPDTPDSPLTTRPPGLSSMAAWEVEDLNAAVALAQERGFTPSEPNQGILPGTRVATIPAAELSGVAMQLLEYV